MTNEDRHRRMDAARIRAELTVQDLWLRYLALGGSGDAFDLDGYLQALVPLEVFQQDVLAQALDEALDDSYRSYRIRCRRTRPTLPATTGSADSSMRSSRTARRRPGPDSRPPAAAPGEAPPPADPTMWQQETQPLQQPPSGLA